ncbi:hypothetical protein [Enterobacter sichuanensis]|uniref:hypothetical protein n=1 Tax=Enterobacter sichuanensis TaxID=2071710 RepID=UPI0021CE6BC6|nr:hypothetical protein [Enterobacter sichuanensis]MCU6194890.1 hypothetical protein [Enterobacter sichuanensis]
MTIKLTENKLELLIETLNAIICDEMNITREQRENMVRTVATLGALSERQRLYATDKAAGKQAKEEKAKKPREPNLVFPRTGKAWVQEDLDLLHSIIDDIPDDSIDDHVLWLSKQLGRTPYAIALKIVSDGRMNEEWAKKKWKPVAKSIREDFARLQSSKKDSKAGDE